MSNDLKDNIKNGLDDMGNNIKKAARNAKTAGENLGDDVKTNINKAQRNVEDDRDDSNDESR